MGMFLKRWVAYLLLPAGMVLLFVPLSTHRSGSIEKDCVFLGVTKTLPGTTADAPAPPVLQPDDLVATPALQAAIEEIDNQLSRWRQESSYALPRRDISPEEWTSFQTHHASNGTFQYENRIFRGRLSCDLAPSQEEVPHLKMGGQIAGALFVLLSLLMLAGCHAAPPAGGIRVGRRSAIIIWDVVIILVGIPFAWWFLDMVFAQVFHTAPEWKEDITWGMGFFMVVLANPVLALITTAMAAQSLSITRESIVLNGLFGSSTVMWAELEGIAVAQAYSPRKAGGAPAPHRVMKFLEIHGGGATLRVMEPPYASTKKLILETLAEHAPGDWQERIATAGKEWLSQW